VSLVFLLASSGLLTLFAVLVVGVLSFVEITRPHTVARRLMQSVAFAVIIAIVGVFLTLVGELHAAIVAGAA
jgi:hypothetical protein